MENSQNKKPNKYVVLATYLIAVVCLLLGLFLPLWGDKGILALQLPDVINKIANKNIITVKKEFALVYPVNFLYTGKTVDIMAWVALLYAVVTAFSLIALIPVAIGTKKDKNKLVSVFAYIVEIAAVLVTSVYVIIALQYQYSNSLIPEGFEELFSAMMPAVSKFSYNMVIALGGCALMLVVLSIMNKKGTGVAKTFLFLFSAIGLLALYNFANIIPKLAEIKKFSPALFGAEGATADGISYLDLLFGGWSSSAPDGSYANYTTVLNSLPAVKYKAAMVLTTIVGLVVLFNFLVDVIALSTNAKKPGYIFNVARYGLELIAVVALVITVAVCKYTVGIMIIVLAAVAVVSAVMSVIRMLLYIKKPHKSADVGAETVVFNQPERHYAKPDPIMVEPEEPVGHETFEQAPEPVLMEEEPPQPRQDKYGFNEPMPDEPVQMEISDIPPQRSTPVEPRPEERPVQPVPFQSVPPVQSNTADPAIHTHVYTINTIYGGPVDDFMRKLTNEEKIEFAMTFIEKSKGNIGNIPDYVIGGNNRLFFSSVFIYLGRIRGLISDGLLNKMYKELNML